MNGSPRVVSLDVHTHASDAELGRGEEDIAVHRHVGGEGPGVGEESRCGNRREMNDRLGTEERVDGLAEVLQIRAQQAERRGRPSSPRSPGTPATSTARTLRPEAIRSRTTARPVLPLAPVTTTVTTGLPSAIDRQGMELLA